MSATNGIGTEAHPLVADTRPLVLLRYRPGVIRQSARTVHQAPLPNSGAGEIRTLCGALLPIDHVEMVTLSRGMPCTMCLLSPPPTSNTPAENRTTTPALSHQDDTDLPLQVAADRYRAWGWPVILRRDHVWLGLDEDTTALIIPVVLAARVTTILRARRCPPPVLAHPYALDHQVLLAGER